MFNTQDFLLKVQYHPDFLSVTQAEDSEIHPITDNHASVFLETLQKVAIDQIHQGHFTLNSLNRKALKHQSLILFLLGNCKMSACL